jgi:phage/plasmid primase-like uncharacterized protein
VNAARVDRDAVLSALVPTAVFDHHGVEYRRCGNEIRAKLCPACGPRSRDAVCVSTVTGLWVCHRCGAHGDVLALVAQLAELDVEREFPRVLERAAEIAGLVGSTFAPTRTRAPAALPTSTLDWDERWAALDRRSLGGERYLMGRGIDPRALRAAGDVVRYTPHGEPAVALCGLEMGELVGIQHRRVDGGEPKVLCARGSRIAGAVLLGRLDDLDDHGEGVDVAVIVEGLADALTAVLAFPGCAVFGAPGANQLESVAAAVAPRVVACRGWLLLVADDDDAGVNGAVAAVRAAQRAGLVLDRDLLLVDLGEHHDLADAWRAAWRWHWPSANRPEGGP